MSNPFDQFSVDLQAALPPSGGGHPTSNGGPPPDAGNPFASMFNDAPSSLGGGPQAAKPVMNAPPMTMNGAGGAGPPPLGQNGGGYGGGYDGGYGGGGYGGGGYGQPPMMQMQPPPPPMEMYGGGGMEQQQPPPPPPMQMPQYGQPAPPPAAPPATPSDPYGGGGYGMGAMAPPPSDPFASYGAMPPAGPPPMSPNPYGAPMAAVVPTTAPSPNPYGQQPPPIGVAAPPQPQLSDPYGGGGGAPPVSEPYGAPTESYGGYGAPPPPVAANDVYGGGGYGAPPPAAAPASDAFGGYGAPPPPAAAAPASDAFGGYGAPPPPSADAYGGYGAPPPPAAPVNDAFGGYGSPPPAAPPVANDPFGGSYGGALGPSSGPPAGPPANDPFGGYGLGGPPPASPNPYAPQQQQPPPPQQQQMTNPYGADPYGGTGGVDPYGGGSLQHLPPYQDPGLGALVVSNQPSQPYAQLPPQYQQAPPPPVTDPFSVFNDKPAPAPAAPMPPPPQQQQPPQSYALVPATGPPPSDTGDVWGDLGFDAPPTTVTVSSAGGGGGGIEPPVEEEKKHEGDLPPGGEFYDARIFTPTLGVMFFKPQELTDSLFLNTDRSLVDGLAERPVVAFIVEGSSARSAGVELGHVLLKVNGVDVKNPKEASRLIKEGPRPLPLLFYVPSTDVVVAEGEHMVKYDTRETTAPNSAKDWKPKYVVIGGIIAQPWMINMYRSKSEYDIAVIETQARRPVSVKVKQFSLQGARIQNDWQGPQMVKYKNKLHPWKYIVVLPVARNPIKISSPNLAQLKPVHEGIRRVLLSQQRSRGGDSAGYSAAPVSTRDPYSQQEYNQAPQQQIQQQQYPQQQQQQQQYNPNAGYAQPSGYTGGY